MRYITPMRLINSPDSSWIPFRALAGGKHDTASPIMDIDQLGAQRSTVILYDHSYAPHRTQVSLGEAIRFVIGNQGERAFSIATADMHHQSSMAMMGAILEADRVHHDMIKWRGSRRSSNRATTYDGPPSVLVEPGKKTELIWTFAKGSTQGWAGIAASPQYSWHSGYSGSPSLSSKERS